MRTLGQISLPFYINRQRFCDSFTILERASTDVYLGLPFLRKHHATVNFQESKVTLSLYNPVHAKSHAVIPPLSEIIIPGVLSEFTRDTHQGECFGFPGTADKGVLVAKAATTVHSNTVPVRLFNSSKSPITINKGERVATFQLWEDDPYLEEP